MPTRDKVLAIRAEQPHATAALIARTIGVTSGWVYQILKEQGLATTIPGAKGRHARRPRSGSAARPRHSASGSGWSRDRHTPRPMGRPGGMLPT